MFITDQVSIFWETSNFILCVMTNYDLVSLFDFNAFLLFSFFICFQNVLSAKSINNYYSFVSEYICKVISTFKNCSILFVTFYLQMSKTKQKGKEDRVTMSTILSALNTIIGVIVVVYIGHKWSNYLQLLHENQMYFSAIKVCLTQKHC